MSVAACGSATTAYHGDPMDADSPPDHWSAVADASVSMPRDSTLPAPLDSLAPEPADATPISRDVAAPESDAYVLDASATDHGGVFIPCAPPIPVALTGALTSISGNPTGRPNEFGDAIHCNSGNGPWAGPQVYYLLRLVAGRTYVLDLQPTTWDAALYAYPASTACKAAAVNAACAAQNSDAFGDRSAEKIVIQPQVTEDWIVAVDSYSISASGAFDLQVHEFRPPSHQTCQQPKQISLGVDPVLVKGNTAAAANQFDGVDCGSGLGPWDGPQVYYRLSLAAGDSVRVRLDAEFDAALYAFEAGPVCTADAVNASCSAGPAGAPRNRFHSDGLGSVAEEVRIASVADGDWIVAVDAAGPSFGGFELTFERYTVAPNRTCAAPLAVDARSQTVTLLGNNLGVVDDLGAVSCGHSRGPWGGGSLYYRLQLQPGRYYRVEAWAQHDAALYAFPAGTACAALAIDAACGAQGVDPFSVLSADATEGAGRERLWLHPPASDPEWIVVVDSHGADGPFKLAVGEYVPAGHTSCQRAKALAVGDSAVGDTSLPGISDEFATVSCGNPNGPWPGPQLYYAATLESGKTYQVAVEAAGWDPAVYAFPASVGCNAALIDQACAAPSALGTLSSDEVGIGRAEQLVITPAATGGWILVVDSWSASAASGSGGFSLRLSE